MKSKFETLVSVVDYVKSESENPINELLAMGFTPCQLVREFGFDKDAVKASDMFSDVEDLLDEKLDETEYPFLLDGYSDFDACLISRYELSESEVIHLKKTACYQRMKKEFQEEKMVAVTDVLNRICDKFENELLKPLKTCS